MILVHPIASWLYLIASVLYMERIFRYLFMSGSCVATNAATAATTTMNTAPLERISRHLLSST
ncbi:MAG: hypothetical protein DLM70_15505 [Chloroflexi bacterium]|nr:MAG: hypothetical protein DLM70_15505 [Chloroflexota bacterium]